MALCPKQIVALEIAATGGGAIVTVTEAIPVHPFALAVITAYAVVVVVLLLMVDVVAPLLQE
jgi:hypothetical protein